MTSSPPSDTISGAAAPPAADSGALADQVKVLARTLGFDLAGIAPVAPDADLAHLRDWLERGYGGPEDGPLGYIARRADERLDPSRLLPGVQSAVVVALRYASAQDVASAPEPRPDEPRIARYARGEDYHELIGDRLRALAAGIEVLVGRPVPSRAYVDTGPVLERAFAVRAGIGWAGKNTLLIHPRLGSYLFLGVLLLDLELLFDTPEPDHCGSCRACLDACPTQAFPAPYVLDATRCIAYTTIEDAGPIPVELRKPQAGNLFGCDICQEVCPWNQRDRAGAEGAADALGLLERLSAREDWQRPDLLWVLNLEEDDWLQATRRSALRRARRRSLLRNALVVAGNTGETCEPPLRARIEAHARGPDPMLAEHAQWALAEIDARG